MHLNTLYVLLVAAAIALGANATDGLNREHQLAPSENRSHQSADGRVATDAAWLNGKMERPKRERYSLLTWTDLLMEGLVKADSIFDPHRPYQISNVLIGFSRRNS